MSRRAAFEVVDQFEGALCEFTGAPYAVAVDSCTNALFLALKWERRRKNWLWESLKVPSHTYVGVKQAAQRAGWEVEWTNEHWHGDYQLKPTCVFDSAKLFERDMYGEGTFTCVSFQAGKLLPIGRGGAILHDNPDADAWFRAARLDGRTEGADYKDNMYNRQGWHCYMTPPDAARGLWLMTYLEDDDKGDWREYPDLSKATWV